jgi:hypothetical protein
MARKALVAALSEVDGTELEQLTDPAVMAALKLYVDIAAKAAPYCRPRLAAVLYKDANDLDKLSDRELLEIVLGEGDTAAANGGAGKPRGVRRAVRLPSGKAPSRHN